MSGKLQYERFFWFHKYIKAGRYPNAKNLSEQFEISHRTAQRTIEFMRDRIQAPLEYDYLNKGFYYSDNTYELPSLWFNEDNVVALSLAVRLASSIPDIATKNKLCALLEEIINRQSTDGKMSFRDISDNISVKNIEYSRVNEQYFTVIVTSLFQKRPLHISYYSPHTKQGTDRTILPLHLIQYMGSWHVIAFCTLRNAIRDFALSRIKAINSTDKKVQLPADLPPVKEFTRKHFGIIQGGKTQKVCLQFTPSVAAWIQEQIWHPEQKTTLKRDGSLQLSFPAADFKELVKRILSHGADVKVISPKELQRVVKSE
ncbi:MAG: helix-turn-helix transcriptional regulator, partial [Planctomycetota bacterium]